MRSGVSFFLKAKICGVSRKLIKDSWCLKTGSFQYLLFCNSTLGKFLTVLISEWKLYEHKFCDKSFKCKLSQVHSFLNLEYSFGISRQNLVFYLIQEVKCFSFPTKHVLSKCFFNWVILNLFCASKNIFLFYF